MHFQGSAVVKAALGVLADVVGSYSNPCYWGDQPGSLIRHLAQVFWLAEWSWRCKGGDRARPWLQGSVAVKAALPWAQ